MTQPEQNEETRVKRGWRPLRSRGRRGVTIGFGALSAGREISFAHRAPQKHRVRHVVGHRRIFPAAVLLPTQPLVIHRAAALRTRDVAFRTLRRSLLPNLPQRS